MFCIINIMFCDFFFVVDVLFVFLFCVLCVLFLFFVVGFKNDNGLYLVVRATYVANSFILFAYFIL